jgi:hypothetical protein
LSLILVLRKVAIEFQIELQDVDAGLAEKPESPPLSS